MLRGESEECCVCEWVSVVEGKAETKQQKERGGIRDHKRERQ